MIEVPVGVRNALKDGLYKKRYHINVFNSDDYAEFVIDNSNIITESIKLTERLCSSDKITFGLAEGSDLEFQYFDYPDITGRRVQVFVDCYYHSDKEVRVNEEYVINDDSTIVLPIKGIEAGGTVTIGAYGIPNRMTSPHGVTVCWSDNDGTYESEVGMMWSITNTNGLSDITIRSHYVQTLGLTYNSKEAVYTIPMGFFIVDQCSRQASTGIIKASCYNKLQSDYLDVNVKDEVCELIETGEGGVPNELSLGTLLYDLLDGYRMPSSGTGVYCLPHPYPYISGFSVDVELYHNYTAGAPADRYIMVCLCDIVISDYNNRYSPTNVTTNEYYDYKIDMDALNAEIAPYQTAFIGLTGNPQETYVYRHYLDEAKTTYKDYKMKEFRDLEQSEAAGFCFVGTETRSSVNDDNSCWGWVTEGSKPKINWGGYTTDTDGWEYPNNVYSSYLMHGTIKSGFRSTYNGIHLKAPLVYATTLNISEAIEACKSRAYAIVNNITRYVSIEKRNTTGLENKRITLETAQALDSITIRDLQSSTFELLGQFGKLDRETDLFSSMKLNNSRLLPSETLLPYTTLYPDGGLELGHPAMYSKLWASENNIHSFRNLYTKRKNMNGDEVEELYVVNANGTDDYYLTDNWLLNNLKWETDEFHKVVNVLYAEMKNIKWFPFEMWCSGLPYVEAGDEIEIMLEHRAYYSYVLTRTLSGIQKLEDTYCNGSLNIF